MQDSNAVAKLAAAQVLTGLYEAIADHSQFDSLFSAMDEFIEADPNGLESSQADWKEMFRRHFSRVGQFLDADLGDNLESPIVHVDRQVVPSAVINRNLDIIAANELFGSIMALDQKSLTDCFASPSDQRNLNKLFTTNEDASPLLVSLVLPDRANPIFAVASVSPLQPLSGQVGPLVTIKIAKATWNPDLVALLDTAYGLTPAEIEVLEGLVEFGAVNEVAKRRQRSVRTVRTQLTNVFGKLGLSSQTELALFLATLTQLITKEKRPSEIGALWSATSSGIETKLIKSDGSDIAYVTYGDPKGHPVLLIHSTTPPDMTPDFRRACADGGLYMIGCHKPGSGGSASRPPNIGPEDMVESYKAALDAEKIKSALIAGHCSGGLYALNFARAYSDKCSALALIDTGIPFKGRRELMSLPKSLRRTFLTARYIPDVLLVPHRIFASNFARSTAGQDRVIDYFFEDSPIDQTLTRTDRTYYEITRRIIAYSFEDVDRLVADVCRWASDWSKCLEITSAKPTAFIHGEDNPLFQIRHIERFAASRSGISVHSVKELSQLQIYQRPDVFIGALRSLIDRME